MANIKLVNTPASSVSTPAAGNTQLFIDESGTLNTKNSSGTVTPVGGGLPDQTGNSGKFLTTDGTTPTWTTPLVTTHQTTTTSTSLAALYSTTDTGAKFVIRGVQGTNIIATEILMTFDGTNVNSVEYGTSVLGTAPGTFSFTVSSGTVTVNTTPASASSTV